LIVEPTNGRQRERRRKNASANDFNREGLRAQGRVEPFENADGLLGTSQQLQRNRVGLDSEVA
jgi:hypothetical protein